MPERFVVAVSGTPGTGKSAFARALARRLDARLIDLNALIRKKKIYKLDANGTRVANLRKMQAEFSKMIKKIPGNIVVEGLLAHLLSAKKLTHVVVLRTRPRILERRLRARKYSGRKLRDNIESEALSIILWEAVQAHGMDKVYEIDTTKLQATAAVKLFLDALAGRRSLRPGKVDWLEEVF
jgi:adenylate kinase